MDVNNPWANYKIIHRKKLWHDFQEVMKFESNRVQKYSSAEQRTRCGYNLIPDFPQATPFSFS